MCITNAVANRVLIVHHVCNIILFHLNNGKRTNFQAYMYLAVHVYANAIRCAYSLNEM